MIWWRGSARESFSQYENNHSLTTCALTIGGTNIKILFMRLFEYKKVFKAYCLQEDGFIIFLK